MTLDDTKGCPGVRLPIKGRAAAICVGCERWGQPSPHIEPMAKRLSGGDWFCPDRRSGDAAEAAVALSVAAETDADAAAPGTSVVTFRAAVGAVTHAADCAPWRKVGTSLPGGGGYSLSDGTEGVSK